MGQFSPSHWLIAVLVIAPLLALTIIPTWRILQRAGFNGAWALLMLVPLVGFVVLWVLAFVRWPNDIEGNTRTSVPWIVAGFIMVPLSIGAVVLMSGAGVRQVAAVEQMAKPVPQQVQPARQRPPTSQAVPHVNEDGPWKKYQDQPKEQIDWEKGTFSPPPTAR
jgi:hypothetical protein